MLDVDHDNELMSSKLRQVEVSDIVSRHGGKRLATSSIPFLIQSNFSSLMNSSELNPYALYKLYHIAYMLYDIGMTAMFLSSFDHRRFFDKESWILQLSASDIRYFIYHCCE